MSVLDNALRQIWTHGLKIVEIWKNASPTSSFGAQDIQLDLTRYDLCAVEHSTAIGGDTRFLITDTARLSELGEGYNGALIFGAFNPQTLQIPELQKYNFIMLLSQYSGGSYFNNSLIIPTEIGTNGAIAVGITMLVSRNFHIVDKAITFENGRLRSTYGSDGTTNNTVALPAYIFGIQLLGGGNTEN